LGEINYETAMLWYRRAAGQGDPDAQNNLGEMFRDGKGVAQSHDEAVKWFRLAAAQDHADALCYLGVCHEKGQDDDAALRLYTRAAAVYKRTSEARGYAEAATAVYRLKARLARATGVIVGSSATSGRGAI
jgi:hypothetical protein